MVRNMEDGHKARCPGCDNPVEHLESSQVVCDRAGIWHSECYREVHGERAAMTEREARDLRVRRWANFDQQPPNPHGARRIA